MKDGLDYLKQAISQDMPGKLPFQRKTQRNNLSEAIANILHLRTVNTSEIAAGLPRKAERIFAEQQLLDSIATWISQTCKIVLMGDRAKAMKRPGLLL